MEKEKKKLQSKTHTKVKSEKHSHFSLLAIATCTLILLGGSLVIQYNQLNNIEILKSQIKRIQSHEILQEKKYEQRAIQNEQLTNGLIQRLDNLSGRVKDAALLEDIESMLTIAEYRAELTQDKQHLLRTLNEVSYIAKQGSLQFSTFRRTLEKLINKLSQESQTIDINSLIAQLHVLSVQTQKSPLKKPKMPEPEPDQQEEATTRWQAVARKAQKFIQSAFTIHRSNENAQPLLTPEQQTNIKLNLHQMYEQAKVAAIQHNDMVYQMSLSKIEKWIKQYFEKQHKETQNVISGIKKMQEIELQSLKFNIGPAWQDLNTLKATLIQQSKENENHQNS